MTASATTNHAVLVSGRNRDGLLDDIARAIGEADVNIEQLIGQGFGLPDVGAAMIFAHIVCDSRDLQRVKDNIQTVLTGYRKEQPDDGDPDTRVEYWENIPVDVPDEMQGFIWRVSLRAKDESGLAARHAAWVRKEGEANGVKPQILTFLADTYVPVGSTRDRRAAVQVFTLRPPEGLSKRDFEQRFSAFGYGCGFQELRIDVL